MRPHTNRDRPLGSELDTQVRFEKLLQEDEGKPKDISSAGKRARPAKYDRRPKTVPTPRDRRQPPTATVTGFSKVKSKIVPADVGRTVLGHEYHMKDPQLQGTKRKYRNPKIFDSWKVKRGKRIPDFHGSDRVFRQSELLRGQEDATLIWGEKMSTVDKVDTSRLPQSRRRPHRVDPLGRPFLYVECDNRRGRTGQKNEGNRVFTTALLVRRNLKDKANYYLKMDGYAF